MRLLHRINGKKKSNMVQGLNIATKFREVSLQMRKITKEL